MTTGELPGPPDLQREEFDHYVEHTAQLAAATGQTPDAAADALSMYGLMLLERARRYGPLRQGELAVQVWRRIRATAHGKMSRPARVLHLGAALYDRAVVWDRDPADQSADRDEAIALWLTGLEALPEGDTNRVAWAGRLSTSLRRRFADCRDLADLDEAIRWSEFAIGIVPPESTYQAIGRSNLALLHLDRHNWTGEQEDLDRALQQGAAAAALQTADPHLSRNLDIGLARVDWSHPSRAAADALKLSLRMAVSELLATEPGGQDQLRCAEALWRRLDYFFTSVDFTPPRSTDALIDAAHQAWARYARSGGGDDLDLAVHLFGFLAGIGQAGRTRSSLTTFLAAVLAERFSRHGDVADLDLGTRAAAAAHADLPDDASAWEKMAATTHVGQLAMLRWRRFGRAEDAREVILALTAAAEMADSRIPLSYRARANLALAEQIEFELTGLREHLDRAVMNTRRALSEARCEERAVAPDVRLEFHQAIPRLHGQLADLLRLRFEQSGALDDLDEAVASARSGSDSEESSPGTRSRSLTALSVCLAQRSERTGQHRDLDEAVDSARKAVALLRPDDRRVVETLSNLSLMRRARFEWVGERSDLDEAVRCSMEATAVVAATSPDRSAVLLAQAQALRERADLDNSMEDLDRALAAANEAVNLAPPSGLLRAMCCSALAGALDRKHDHTGRQLALTAAVAAARAAVAATDESVSARPLLLHNLAQTLRKLPEDAGLDEAVATTRSAIDLAATSDRHRAMMLSALARLVLDGRGGGAASPTLERALQLWQEASDLKTSPSLDRFIAAKSMAATAHEAGSLPAAAEGYRTALALLPTFVWHGLERGNRERLLVDSVGVGSDAAACMVELEASGDAVVALTQGQTILWDQLLDARRSLDSLSALAPALAEQMSATRRRLDDLTLPRLLEEVNAAGH